MGVSRSFLEDRPPLARLAAPKRSASTPARAYFQAAVHRLATRPHFANPGLLHQAALKVVIGDSCGDARAAGLGALGP